MYLLRLSLMMLIVKLMIFYPHIAKRKSSLTVLSHEVPIGAGSSGPIIDYNFATLSASTLQEYIKIKACGEEMDLPVSFISVEQR